MKRGNTALKRVVSVASVAAMAIAGAVLAAPAASAWTAASSDLVRATPAVDAPWINDASNPLYTATYASVDGAGTKSTGAVPNLTIGQTFQAASGLQIALPAAAGVPVWEAGDAIVVTLTGATFSQTPTGISVGAKPINKADLASRAGFAGTNATAAPAQGTGGLTSAALSSSPTLNTAKTELTIPLPNPANNATAGDSYLLSISNVKLSVAADASGATVVPVIATVTGTGAGTLPTASSTTIAFVNNLKLALNGTATITGSTVKLPPIVVNEAAKDAFAAGASGFTVKVTGTDLDATHAVTLTQPATATVAASSTVTAAGPAALSVADLTVTGAAGTAAVAYNASDATKVETVVISGLEVTNVKPGTDLTVAISVPTGTASNTALSTFAFTPNQTAGASVTVTPGTVLPRIAGTNRYATAADIAAESTWSGNAVVIANGENMKQGIDALSANFLAGAKNAPILLTSATALPAETKDALTALFKNSTADITIYVMGKTDAVSQDVRDAASAAVKATSVSGIATVTVKEVAGSDRYATSVASIDAADSGNIAAYDLGKGNLRTAFLASGQVNADALAASAVSAGSSIPVLLTTNGDVLPTGVKDAITANHIDQVVILGATDRVSQKVQDDLSAAGVNVIRLAGADRFDTAVKIATLDRKTPTDGTGRAASTADVYLANGLGGFPDALAVGPLAGKQHASLVTVSNATALPTTTAAFLTAYKGDLVSVHALGASDRIADSVITEAQGLIK